MTSSDISYLHVVPEHEPLSTGTMMGRISRVHRGECDVLTVGGEQRAETSAAMRTAAHTDPSQAPCVGDLCVIARQGEVLRLVELLPRRTAVTRASVNNNSSHRQVLAANVDLLAVVEPLGSAPVLGRVERLLTLAWDAGAMPVVLLSKADLDPDPEEWVREVSLSAPGAPVIAVSQRTGEGIAALRALLGPGRILAFIGQSGAGKSSLVNALANQEVMATKDIREDGRGRHTTVHRELVVLPDGSLIIDTPGLRSIGLASTEALDQVFSDVRELAEHCRFTDCGHVTEPGCAVLAAIEQGDLAERRLLSWRKLQREADYQERRTDARLRAAEKERWKQQAKQMRSRGRNRP